MHIQQSVLCIVLWPFHKRFGRRVWHWLNVTKPLKFLTLMLPKLLRIFNSIRSWSCQLPSTSEAFLTLRSQKISFVFQQEQNFQRRLIVTNGRAERRPVKQSYLSRRKKSSWDPNTNNVQNGSLRTILQWRKNYFQFDLAFVITHSTFRYRKQNGNTKHSLKGSCKYWYKS